MDPVERQASSTFFRKKLPYGSVPPTVAKRLSILFIYREDK